MRPTAGADITASRSAAGVRGQRLAVERAAPTGHAGVAGDRARRSPARRRRAPSGRRPASAKKATVSAALGRSRSASDDQAERPHAVGERRLRAGGSGSGASVRPSASTRRPALPPRAPCSARPGRRRRSARAHPAPGARRRGRARSSAGARRTAPARDLASASTSASPASAIASQGQVARRRAGGVARERRAPASPRRRRRAGTSPTTRSVGSVSVPVLSVQTTSTEASDSTALSCWASTPRWAILNADTAAVRLIEQDQALGDEVDDPGGQRLHALARRGSRSSTEIVSPTAERDRDATSHSSSRSLAALERRARVAERARRGRELRRRGCPGPPPWPRRAPRPRPRTSPTTRARPRPRTTGSDSPVRLASSSASPSAPTTRPVGDDLVARPPAAPGRRRPPVDAAPGGRRPSRTTTASGATSAASRSSARLERTSWKDPIAMFETRIPRNSASRHDSNAIVSTPNTNRIPLGIVSVLARTMLA